MSGIKAMSLEEVLGVIAASETGRAKEVHGTTYASHHEAFGVLAEEVQEAGEEHKSVQKHMEQLLRFVRTDYTEGIADCLRVLMQDAIRAAAESVQVAAVCSKWLDMMGGAENVSHP